MPTFVAHLSQSNGCDYTIGCGQKVVRFESTDIETAVRVLQLSLRELIGIDAIFSLQSLVVYEVATEHLQINIDNLKLQLKQDLKEEDNRSKERIELAEYERLKRKFG